MKKEIRTFKDMQDQYPQTYDVMMVMMHIIVVFVGSKKGTEELHKFVDFCWEIYEKNGIDKIDDCVKTYAKNKVEDAIKELQEKSKVS